MIPMLACCLIGVLFFCTVAQARQEENGWLSDIDMDWGGHLRAISSVSFLEEDSIYQYADTGPYSDGQFELRVKNQIYLGPRWSMQTHYELVGLGGDTYENTQHLEQELPPHLEGYLPSSQGTNDDRRFFNLTRQITEEENYLVYHRLDRLNLTCTLDWGTMRIGRQALTWGDGMLFNPMDLFNPFKPTTVQRDYKTGDDMIYLQFPTGEAEIQLLYLPRRDPDTGDLQSDQSSYALKYHTPAGFFELDLMAARHYDDDIVGMGATGYLRDAAWRINTTYTRISEESSQDDFIQIVANMDYAWMWAGKNVYGLLEFYYNGLGRNGNYDHIITDSSLMKRLERGELYTIGRYYLAGQVQIELHPLVKLDTLAIVNLYDASGILQPQALWDITSNIQVIVGAQGHWGGGNSEYGGYDVSVANATINTAPADRIFFWLTYHF
ncbi:hypothetical protein ACFL2E_10730 [Thermodesulfobacteriota bacterium]